MAFDMYLDDERAYIDHHEEGIFSLINEDEKCPRLNWIWQEFYDSPVIEPNVANELVHELIAVRCLIPREQRHLVLLIDRLLPFFSKGFVASKSIRCSGD